MSRFFFMLLFVLSLSKPNAQGPTFKFPIENTLVVDTLAYYEPLICTYPKAGEYLYVDNYGGWLEITKAATYDDMTIRARNQAGTMYTIHENSGRALYVHKYYGVGKIPCPKTISKPSYKEVVTNNYLRTSDGKIILTQDIGGNWKRTVMYQTKSKVATGYVEEICPHCQGTGFRESSASVVKYGKITRLGFQRYLDNWKREKELFRQGRGDFAWSGKRGIDTAAKQFADYYHSVSKDDSSTAIADYLRQLQDEWIQLADVSMTLSFAYYNLLNKLYHTDKKMALSFFNHLYPAAFPGVIREVSSRDTTQLKYYLLNGNNLALLPEVKNFFISYYRRPEGVAEYVTAIGQSIADQEYKGEQMYLRFTTILKEIYHIDHYASFRCLMVANKATTDFAMKYLPPDIKSYMSEQARIWLKNKNAGKH